MDQKIHPKHILLPDADGTVIAAGPLVGGGCMLHNRTVLRRERDKSYVIHSQQYPDVDDDNPKPFRDYHQGDYVGKEDAKAFAAFVKRLVRQGQVDFGLSVNDMVPSK